MRYDCEDEALKGDFVEFSDRWSRAQVRAMWAAKEEGELLDVLRPKVIALHLTCDEADPITDPDELVPERTEQLDTALYAWFSAAWVRHLSELADRGNALSRTLFATSDEKKEKKQAPGKHPPSRKR